MTSKKVAIIRCNALSGGKRAECLEMVELCAAGKTTIQTDVGEVKTKSIESCYEKATKLAGMGYEILSGKAPPGGAPESTPKPAPQPAPTPTHDEPSPAGEPQVPATPSPESKPGVIPMRENDMRRGYCTEQTGFVPMSRAKVKWMDGVPRLVIDGRPMEQGPEPIPVLSQHIDRRGLRIIMLPYREVHFKLDRAEPRRVSKFKRTIGRMIGDIKNVVSGPFARICGLDYLKEFAGDLTLYVVGKTDRLGTEEHNLELSEARAKTVADAIYERKGEISKALWGGGNGLRIKYIGVGEQQTETGDEVASPDDRRVELYLSTKGPPIAGQWAEVGGLEAGADQSDFLEYYCGGADSDCENVIAQCESSMKLMCEKAYPYSFVDQERCAAETGAWMMAGEVGDPAVKEWLDKGYFRFPIRYDRDVTINGGEFIGSLKQCLRRAPAIARDHRVEPFSWASSLAVIHPKATLGTIPRGTKYCTAEHGWMESSRTMISETPEGEMIWYDRRPVATLGRQWVKIKQGRRETLAQPVHPIALDSSSVYDVARTVANELLDFILVGKLNRRCMDGRKNRVVVIEFWSDSIGVHVQRKMDEVVDIVESMLKEYRDRFPYGTRIAARFNLISPDGEHRGLFVGTSIPANYSMLEQQGSYGPTHKNGGSGTIEVIPLR
jgi:hypothetical protein